MKVLDTILRESALQAARFEVLFAELASLKRTVEDLPAFIAGEVASLRREINGGIGPSELAPAARAVKSHERIKAP